MKHSHNAGHLLTAHNSEYKEKINAYFAKELHDDLFPSGDRTCNILQAYAQSQCTAYIKVKADGVISGIEECSCFLKGFNIYIVWHVADGDTVKVSNIIAELSGLAADILKVERIILNFLGRMSGISTYTKKCVEQVPSTVLICPTRKTVWGVFDKKACVIGGGGTHRLNLSSGVMFKENHLTLLPLRDIQNLSNLLEKNDGNMGAFCEIEVETEKEAETAIQVLSKLKKTQAVIMFDNFSAKKLKNSLEKLKKQYPQESKNILFEASGGIDTHNIHEYKNTGVNIISSGAITHSSKSLDLSLRIEI